METRQTDNVHSSTKLIRLFHDVAARSKIANLTILPLILTLLPLLVQVHVPCRAAGSDFDLSRRGFHVLHDEKRFGFNCLLNFEGKFATSLATLNISSYVRGASNDNDHFNANSIQVDSRNNNCHGRNVTRSNVNYLLPMP